MNEEEIVGLMTLLGVVITCGAVFGKNWYDTWKWRGFSRGSQVFLSKNFPAVEMRGLKCTIASSWQYLDEIKVIFDNDKLVKRYENTINSYHGLNLSRSGYYFDDNDKRQFVLEGERKHFSLKQYMPVEESKKLIKKKGRKMPRMHRFLLNSAWVYLAWTIVLNVEEIVKFIIGLFQ